MKKILVLIFGLGLLIGLVGMASADQFTLSSYNVTLNMADPGLILYWNPILTPSKTWNLNVGQDTGWFDLFKVGTDESWINPDDINQKPITVSFVWTAPSGAVPDTVNGQTNGWTLLLAQGGQVTWSDSPAVFNFGNGGKFTLALKDGCWSDFLSPKGYTDIDAKLTYVSASVPEPGTLLFLGFGLVGLAGLRKKFKK